jgi:hypothetical protein
MSIDNLPTEEKMRRLTERLDLIFNHLKPTERDEMVITLLRWLGKRNVKHLRGDVYEVEGVADAEKLQREWEGRGETRKQIPYAKIQIDCRDGYTEELELPIRELPDGITKGTWLMLFFLIDEGMAL